MSETRIERTNYEGSWDDPCPYCGEPQLDHRRVLGEHQGVVYEHRQPCEPEQSQITKRWVHRARTVKGLVLLWWVLIPLFIAVVGFASPLVGFLLFGISLAKIAWTSVCLFGKPGRWLPGYQENQEKQPRMEHYFYHCEKNPLGFQRLLVENLSEDDAEA